MTDKGGWPRLFEEEMTEVLRRRKSQWPEAVDPARGQPRHGEAVPAPSGPGHAAPETETNGELTERRILTAMPDIRCRNRLRTPVKGFGGPRPTVRPRVLYSRSGCS